MDFEVKKVIYESFVKQIEVLDKNSYHNSPELYTIGKDPSNAIKNRYVNQKMKQFINLVIKVFFHLIKLWFQQLNALILMQIGL